MGPNYAKHNLSTSSPPSHASNPQMKNIDDDDDEGNLLSP